MTPDLYAASNYGIRYVQIMAVANLLRKHGRSKDFQIPDKWTQPSDTHLMISLSAVRVSAERFQTRSRHHLDTSNRVFISGYCNNFATINRKAPAFLRGLLQFGCSLVGDGGLEPPTPCL